ncbi:MAG: cytochrome P450 [Acidobacteriota bacterium]
MVRELIRTGNDIIPGPSGHFLFGNLREIQDNPLNFYLQLRRSFGDVVRLRLLPFYHAYLVFHPNGVDHVLQANQINYRKVTPANKAVEVFLGKGLLTSDEDIWRQHRSLTKPAFHPRHFPTLATTIIHYTERMAESWRSSKVNGKVINLLPEMLHLALQIASKTLFSIDISEQVNSVAEAVGIAFEHVGYCLTHPFMLPKFIPTSRNRRFQQAKHTLDEFVTNIIKKRRATGSDSADLLSLLLTEDNQTALNDQQLRDEAITFLTAGYETTAVALSWTWYLLAKHPDIQKRLQQELTQVLNGRTATFEDLQRLHYTKMVFEETLRLYPPAWTMLPRMAIKDDIIDGFHIPAGSIVSVSQYVTHRHPDFWSKPAEFNPDHFTPEHSAHRHPYAYFPFGGGARQCIGKHFALIEAQLIIATLAQRFEFKLIADHPIELDPAFALKPRHGIMVYCISR